MAEFVTMALYSLLLAGVLLLGAPYWLWRMVRGLSGNESLISVLAQRLSRVPRDLRAALAGRQVVWVHAVSVGEVLAATHLIAELETALAEGWIIVVSTTTATGQALARQRFAAARVFYYPLDFAFAVRAYLRALNPRMLVLMESELWPRMMVECNRAHIPIAVANARVSDRSYARGLRVRAIWSRLLRRVSLFLAQSDQDARRLVEMGARSEAVHATGNLKYDVRAPQASRIAELIRIAAAGRPIVVAGSTVDGRPQFEEQLVMQAGMGPVWQEFPGALLVLAPRHPQRFDEAWSLVSELGTAVRATDLLHAGGMLLPATRVVLLDTVGDLAAVYGLANAAFVGGSLVPRGGHNPLEPAQFGVPTIIGPSYENFRDIVEKMKAADGIRIVHDGDQLQASLIELLADPAAARALGERGRSVFEAQQGATTRTVDALMALMPANAARDTPPQPALTPEGPSR